MFMALDGRNTWSAPEKVDYAAFSMARCLCDCAAGLFGDTCSSAAIAKTLVLAPVASHPGM